MVSKDMLALGKKSSVIREIFEYAKVRRAEIGAENVFDFSLGNPSIPAPAVVGETMQKLLAETDPVLLHGYSSAPGDMGVRQTIATHIKERFGLEANPNLIYMTCGAAASLTVSSWPSTSHCTQERPSASAACSTVSLYPSSILVT